MENIKEKMLDALKSVFWYEGLLTEDNSGNYSTTCWLVKFIDDLEKNANTKYQNMYTVEDLEAFNKNNDFDEDEFDQCERHTVIWQMLVEMFGDCGTSPRFGWIEKRKECAEFLKEIMNAPYIN